MATRCRDCDSVPKVADAGQVFTGPDGRRVQIMHNGLKVVADGYYGAWMTDLIRLCRGHHESQEERLFHELVGRLPVDARMIEMGGFWSYYSLWFLKDQPQRQSVVIEPEPTHLAIGQDNARLNRLSPTFKQGFAGANFSASEPFTCEVSGDQLMPRYSVRHLMEEQGWTHLDLLHCDIQGAETEVLESCRDLFTSGAIDWIFVSTHAHQISGDPLTHQRCLSILRECGATIEADHDVHESFSGDGLIVARFGSPPPGWMPVALSNNRASQSLFRHLAYDLDDSNKALAAARADLAARDAAAAVHPDLRQSGGLFTLREPGPLGDRGATILLPDDEVMSRSVKASSGWDLPLLEAFVARVPEDKNYTLVDVGANIGLFSRQIALRVPAITKFVCIEPERDNFAALHYNLGPLGDRVALHNIALGDVDGCADLMRDSGNIGNYSVNPDAMRGRTFDKIEVVMRATSDWMEEQLGGDGALLWKSDTQGSDEAIVAAVPMAIWNRIEVAIMEMWRIEKPAYDRDAFRARIESFPNRHLGDKGQVSADEVFAYLDASDWQFTDLLLWR